jgi:P-type Cu2+ transporter
MSTAIDTPQHHEQLRLQGMRCAACAQLIEFRVKQLSGVESFRINQASHKAEITWNDDKISLRKIIAAITDLGYGALPASERADEQQARENKKALWRLFIAGFAMMQVMMYAWPGYLVPVPTEDGDLTPDLDKLLKIASMLITLPVIAFSAQPFFKAAWRDLQNRHVGMDVPVSLGILLTFFASVWATFNGGAVYFDSAIMFVFLLLGARYIEEKVQRKTANALQVLTQLSPPQAQRLNDYPASRNALTIDASEVAVNDYLLVAAGEQIPADGVVIEGSSECDESLMTGESHPVSKGVGSTLIAGAINLNGALVMQANQVGGDTQLSALVRMMESASADKPPLVLLAEKHASRFLFIILLVALGSGIGWYFIDPSRALWIAISVIVVTCPCALSLATPGVMAAAIGQLAKHGVLIAKGRAIEAWSKATHVVFDKTGTLTYGKLKLVENLRVRHDFTGLLTSDQLAYVLASHSSHPVAKAVADATAEKRPLLRPEQVTDLKEIAGGGIEAIINRKMYRLGSIAFVSELVGAAKENSADAVPAHLSDKTLSALGDEKGIIALYALDDSLRSDAKALVQSLQTSGKHVLLLSGDRADVAHKIGAECGISDAQGGLSPNDKYAVVKQLQSEGAVVMMVGDGMNDGPVLSLANVSVAMGNGAPISQTRSDVVLMSNRLGDLAYGTRIAKLAQRVIHQNLWWAIVYNAIAIPAAVIGWLEPWHAALGMSLSSLIVVLNSLRLLRVNQAPQDAIPMISPATAHNAE